MRVCDHKGKLQAKTFQISTSWCWVARVKGPRCSALKTGLFLSRDFWFCAAVRSKETLYVCPPTTPLSLSFSHTHTHLEVRHMKEEQCECRLSVTCTGCLVVAHLIKMFKND